MPTIQPISKITREKFLKKIGSKETSLYYLTGSNDFEVAITNYGARIAAVYVKDKDGNVRDVLLGFDSIDGYLETKEIYHGAIVGRYANRIAKGGFSIGDETYTLAKNNGVNSLHGGNKGYDSVVWDVVEHSESELVLHYLSEDGEEGFPGNLDITVRYSVKGEELAVDFKATTDKPTVVNLTNHAYFNLNGQGSGSVHNHLLMINADHITPVDDTLIPTGKLQPVEQTPFDFRSATAIGARIDNDDAQLKYGGGYDHNFVLNKNGNEWSVAATATGDQSGIKMEVWTTEPGVQLYTGNFMKGESRLKYGLTDKLRSAFCLETQHFPDSPNQPQFPSTGLKPGDIYSSKTAFRFTR